MENNIKTQININFVNHNQKEFEHLVRGMLMDLDSGYYR